ncbi:MAG: hypothetical protein WAL27_12895, partial [Cellulosimicrobium cellulans]
LMGLVGCSGGGTSPSVTGDAATMTPGTVKPAPETTTATPTPTAPRVAAFGQQATWPDGVGIKVDFAGWRPAGEYASGAVEGRLALFTITLINNSQAEVDGGFLAMPRAAAGPQNKEVEQATDYEQDIGYSTFSTVLPGESQQVQTAYGIPAELVSSVRLEFKDPNYTNPPIIFKGAIPAS